MMAAALCGAGLLLIFFAASSLLAQAQHLVGPTQPVPENYFGMHVQNYAIRTPWPTVRFGSWRIWDAWVAWRNLEPTQGQWEFGRLDSLIEAAEKNRVEPVLILGRSPKWAALRPQDGPAVVPGSASPPRDINDWRRYVMTVATRYRGRIHYYEIWNEPNLSDFFTGTPEEMLALSRVAYEELKAIDPTVTVVGPSPTSGLNGAKWLDRYFQLGGERYLDVVGFHFYVGAKEPESMLPLITAVQKTMQAHGVRKPLWNTETGWSQPKPMPAETGAAYVARAFLLNWAAGVERFYWYSWDNHDWVSLEMVERDEKTLRPAAEAYQQVRAWMLGARVENCSSSPSSTWICTLQKDGKRQWIVWNATRSTNFTIPQDWQVTSVTNLQSDQKRILERSITINSAPVRLN